MRTILFALALLVAACHPSAPTVPPPAKVPLTGEPLTDKGLLDKVQEAAFRYFWDGAHPASVMALERSSVPDTVTSGGTGFGVAATVVATERGWITRAAAVERLNQLTTFLEKADRFHGAWPHWLHGATGKAIAFGPDDDGGDLVETSYLVNGLLMAETYFNGANADETALRQRIGRLWTGVEWDWYAPNGLLLWHWSPRVGWKMNMPIRGYNECLITYVLALASPTHPITPDVYRNTWTVSPNFRNGNDYLGYRLDLGFPYGGPLFFSHYSYLGLDPRQMQDEHTNYWRQVTHHTLINRAYCLEQAPKDHQYSENVWGLTASDNYQFYGAHQPTEDNGTVAPTAALSSFPYTPAYSMQATRYFYETLGKRLWGRFGFYDAFALNKNWFDTQYLAIDQGPIVVMIENYRSGLGWRLFTPRPDVQAALAKMGIRKPTYATGFYAATPEKRSGRVALIRHPDRGQYEIDVCLADAAPATLHLLDAQQSPRPISWPTPAIGAQVVTFDAPPGDYTLELTAGATTHQLPVTLR